MKTCTIYDKKLHIDKKFVDSNSIFVDSNSIFLSQICCCLSRFQVSRSLLSDFEALMRAMFHYPLHFYDIHKIGLLLLSVFINVMSIYLNTYNMCNHAQSGMVLK